MTYKEAYQQFAAALQPLYAAGEAAAVTTLAMEALVPGWKQTQHADFTIAANDREQLGHWQAALLLGKPVQYVLGTAWFYGMQLTVNSAVLIPRPETEELVEWTVQACAADVAPHLLDIGTGSGCIAIALKKLLPHAQVTAVDVSSAALELARHNAAVQGVAVTFIQSDFLQEELWPQLPVVDVIVSNPPYIPEHEKAGMDYNVVAWEPHGALFVPDSQPLLFYEKIARFGKKHLLPGGRILVETHQAFTQQAVAQFERLYTAVTSRKDISGNDRMIQIS